MKDVAGDVEILLRGGGEASTQVHSAWFMQRNVKVFLEALAAPDDASSPGVRTHWASDNILYRLSWGPATAAEEELMLGPPAAILTIAKLSAAYFEPPARHDAILAAWGPALVKQLDVMDVLGADGGQQTIDLLRMIGMLGGSQETVTTADLADVWCLLAAQPVAEVTDAAERAAYYLYAGHHTPHSLTGLRRLGKALAAVPNLASLLAPHRSITGDDPPHTAVRRLRKAWRS